MSLGNQLASLAAGLALASPSLASTWIVDDDGGVGVHFTDLPPAIAAAVDGDVILVKPGAYNGFTSIGKAVKVLGEPGVLVAGPIAIAQTPSTSVAALTDVALAPGALLTIVNCQGPVLVQRVDASLSGGFNTDLRCFELHTAGFFSQDHGRTEVVRSLSVGSNGASGLHPTPGTPGYRVTLGTLHLALSSGRGGDGGNLSPQQNPSDSAERGGDGVVAHSSFLLIAGVSTDQFVGGKGGVDLYQGGQGPWCGDGGDGISGAPAGGQSSVWWSSVTPVAGAAGSNGVCGPGVSVTVGAIAVSPADPTLDLLGTATPGQSVTFRVRGQPGAPAKLYLGRKPVLVADGLAQVEKLTQHLRTVDLGTLPASGEADYSLTIPNLAPGFTICAQAEVFVQPANQLRRSNSAVAIIR